MNRSRLIRRALVLAAGAALATTASLVATSPAAAHDALVRGEAVCLPETGEWTVTWTVENDQADLEATITDVRWTPEGSTLTGIEVDATLPAGGELVGEQVVAGDAELATIEITALWKRGSKDIVREAGNKVELKGTCEEPTPSPEPTPPASPEPTPTAVPSPSETPAPGEGGGLPVTGTAVGGIVGAAALLLAAGVGLFLMARRRRIRFTA